MSPEEEMMSDERRDMNVYTVIFEMLYNSCVVDNK